MNSKYTYDIVYIKGNPNSGTSFDHENINNSIIKLINNYNYKVISSTQNNISIQNVPNAKIYIGFSRGSRYLNKLSKNSLKISIGGISGYKVNLFKNTNDNILLGDISKSSMQAHFIIMEEHKIKIKELINDFFNISLINTLHYI